MSDFIKQISRRRFIKNYTLGTAGLIITPTILKSCTNSAAPNDKITVGMIGTGSHGIGWNLKQYLEASDLCRVVAVCDVSKSRANKAKEIVNEAYNSKDCKVYQDFRELLADGSIDAVQISTPDHWHVPISIMAALKGKHVCCEKPTLTIDEGRLLCNVIEKTGVVYQVSVEDRFVPEYHQMAELVLNGRIGQLNDIKIQLPTMQLPNKNLEVNNPPKDFDYDLWLGPAPEIPFIYSRTFFHFRWHEAFSGGILTDWGAHYCDTAQLVTGNDLAGPTEVEPYGKTLFYNDGIFNTAYQYDLRYKYTNNINMQVKNGSPLIRLEGDEGWLESKGWRSPLVANNDKILDLDDSEKKVVLPTSKNEHVNFLESINNNCNTVYTSEKGHRLSTLLHCGNIALKLNRKIQWDPSRERFFDDPEAEKFRKREMREMWSYSKICPEFNY